MILPKAIVVDTNVLIHDPESIEVLMNDINILFLHTLVLQELDGLKTQRDIGRDCREAIRKIEQLHKDNNPRLKIIQHSDWSDSRLSHLNQSKNDHHIIALAVNLLDNEEYKGVKLISKDTAVRILARDVGLVAEDYISESIKIDNTNLKEVEAPHGAIHYDDNGFYFDVSGDGYIENEGVVCWSDWNGNLDPHSNTEWRKNFTAIKKGKHFRIINNHISMMSVVPYSMDKLKNWEQYIAMQQLMDDDVKCAFMIGGAGSGKTMLALAAAMEQRSKFRNILITRPMVHLEDEDRMGFLPGSVDEKMAPWLRPIYRTISQIGSINTDNAKIIQKIRENNKIEIEPLDYIRGMTFVKDILIVDEAQNLTPHQMKTIITRVGERSKIIFTGDLGQIDRLKKIDSYSSGLAYASVKMAGERMVSTVHFKKTVRSELAERAEKLL